MSRTRLLALAPALLLAAARAEEPKPAAAPATAADPAVEALVKQAVEKAKQELREEVRVELQGAQAASMMGTAAEAPKFQLIELDGYLRTRGDLFDNFALKRGPDTSGFSVWPRTVFNPDSRGTQATTNMRLRLEPTINVSEHVRVRAQTDVLDNYVFGSSPNDLQNPLRQGLVDPLQQDRAIVNVKRAWGEVEVPFGLLSFGRMPSVWGLGIVAPAADGLDDDLGITVDRIQFATLPVPTPLGPLTFVPYLTFDREGVLSPDPHLKAGLGQPFDRDSGDDGRTWGLKLVRLDTEQEMRRKFERGEASLNYGAFYEYSTLPKVNLAWLTQGYGASAVNLDPINSTVNGPWIDRREYRHSVDLWFRYRTARFHLEAEVAGVIGQIGNPGPFSYTIGTDGTYTPGLTYDGPSVLLREFGGAVRASYQVAPGKFAFGAELGLASGDPAPGFGNDPSRLNGQSGSPGLPTWNGSVGPLEGPQYGLNCPNAGCDRTISNFRFNPGYRIDMILWRELLGNVTDAFYLKPSIRWDIVGGLALDAQLVYSQAVYASSTPSAGSAKSGSSPLGIELDTKLTYATDDGFHAWLQYGVLQPLDGFSGAGSLSRAHAIRAGLAIKF